MLSVTKVKLDLVSDVGMYLFLFLIFLKDTAKANNKYLKSYDNKKPTKYITCLHKNNLYNHPMSEFLPKNLPLLTLFETRIKNKKIISCIEPDQSKWQKLCIEFNTKRKSRKKW